MNTDDLLAFSARVKVGWEAKEFNVPVHLAGGNEEELVDIFKEVKDGDYVFSTHRNMYHALLCGIKPDDLLAAYRQEPAGSLGPNCGCMCIVDHGHKFYCSAIVGGNVAPAVGVAWALKEQGKTGQVLCFVGDGAVDTGHFWEGLRYAQGWNLPITFVVEDNDRSVRTRVTERWGKRAGNIEASWDKVRYYSYVPTYQHVGTGTFIHF